MSQNKSAFGRRLLSVEGQIIAALAGGPKIASEIYNTVSASQPTISEKLARMIAKGEVIQINSMEDRRVRTYILAPVFRQSIAAYLHILEPLIGSDVRQSSAFAAAS